MSKNNSTNQKKNTDIRKPAIQNESTQAKVENQQELSGNTKKDQLTIPDWINVVIAILTLFSVIGVFVTVNEMKTDRKAAYTPSIVMLPLTVDVTWDEKGFESWLNTEHDMIEIIPSKKDYSEGKINISFQPLLGSLSRNYDVLNIGVAAAKNILFEWDDKNTQRLIDYLVELDSSKKEFCSINEENISFYFKYKEETHSVLTNKNEDSQLMYILPATDTDDTYSIIFPAAYSILLNEIMKSGQYSNSSMNGPYLFLKISGYDIQNNRFADVIMFQFKRLGYEEKEDGSGNSSYQIIPTFSE